MTTQSEKDFKSYHITYDENQYNDTIDHIEDILKDTKLGVNKIMPYLWVAEIGTTGKRHYHCYFFSSKSKNTVKKYMFVHTKEALKVSNPDDAKYAKHNKDGVKGVEIYLHKGCTNHMCKNDDLKVMPRKICQNNEYYGNIENDTSRSYKIRQMYQKTVEDLKKYAKECRKINEENKLTEYQTILKDLSKKTQMSPGEICDYLIDVHYMRPKYIYTENGFKRNFLKILREKNEFTYKEIMKDSMNAIMSNAFHL